MKFGFIAKRPQKSFECLAERAKLRGHAVEHIPLPNDISLSGNGVRDFFEYCAGNYDALHYYVGIADSIGITFGQICIERDVPLLNNRAKLPWLVSNKMFQTLSFARAGLPIPKTEFSHTPEWKTLTSKLGNPLIAKRVRGAQGRHVHVIKGQEELSVIEQPAEHVFQEYVPHTNDVRVLVLDGKAVCGYRRFPAEGDFRSNLALGGHAEALSDDSEKEQVFKLAEYAVKEMGHELAGVDLIKSQKDGLYRLIEINVNPSWYGIYGSTNVHFEDVLLDKYENMANLKSTKVDLL